MEKFKTELLPASTYQTTFQGDFNKVRECWKIEANKIDQQVDCSRLVEPDAIHVAQRAQFADAAHEQAFERNLNLKPQPPK
jgi:hypothetical protein